MSVFRKGPASRRIVSQILFVIFVTILQTFSLLGEVPKLKGPVNDYANLISAEEESEISNKLKTFEQRKGSQIFILTIHSLNERSIEDYSQEVFETWKPGRKGVDDGILIVIVQDSRQLRIQTGYALEGVIPDVVAKRIIERIMVPRFKEGNFGQGVEDAIDVLIPLIEGENLPDSVKDIDTIPTENVPGFIFFLVCGLLNIPSIIFGLIRWTKLGIVSLFLALITWLPSILLTATIIRIDEPYASLLAICAFLVLLWNFCMMIIYFTLNRDRSEKHSASSEMGRSSFGTFTSTRDVTTSSSTDSYSGDSSSSSSDYSSSSSDYSSSSDSSSSSDTSGGGGDSGGGGASGNW